MGIQGPFVGSALAMLMAASLGLAGLARAAPVPIEQNGISYVTGGIGSDEQQSFHDMIKDFSLHLAFASKGTGSFLADIQVTIQDAKGAALLNVTSEGPCLFARLPPGRYKVLARNGDVEIRKAVTLALNHPRNLVFLWPAEAGEEEIADDPESPNKDDGPPGCW